MELVYLWVEEYKNIHRQGFNFSPRFECKFYDEYENGDLKDGCELIICDKEKGECLDKDTKKCKPCQDNGYIKDFFGKKINVTAIVGKNGSGKSSVLELLTNVISEANSKYMIIAIDENNKYLHYGTIKNIECNVDCSLNNQKIVFSTIELCPKITKTYNSTHFFINEKPSVVSGYYVNAEDDNIVIPKYIIALKKNSKLFNNKAFYYQFDKVRFILKPYHITDVISEIEKMFKVPRNKIVYIKELIEFINQDNKFINSLKIMLIKYYLFHLENEDGYQDEVIETISKLHSLLDIKEVLDKIIKSEDLNNIKEAINYIDTIDLKSRRNKINDSILYYYEIDIENSNIEKLWIFESLLDKYYNSYQNLPIFDLELFDSKKNILYNELSGGEKQYIRILIESLVHINPQNSKHSSSEAKIYFFDEVETSLHPQWQKKLVFDISNIMKSLDKHLHIVFLTHSPFLLSDIPKQNIIFLDTYKEEDEEVKNGKQKVGNCKVVDGLNEKKETFGANIHTLLSDSFFMKDGLMGEFAKDKINKIIRFLNGDNKFIDFPINQIKKVIEVIGEPFLKQKLLDMYNKKFIKEYKDRQKEKIKKQIEDLNNQLKELDND